MRAPVALALALCACGAEYDGAYSAPDAGGWACFSSNDCPTGWTCTEFGTCEAPPPPPGDAGPTAPPEVEREFGPPSSALRYVYVTMPDLDALAKIDGATLAVASVPVGDRPGLVVTVPGADDALVLDRGSSTATIVRPTVDRDERVTLPTLPRLNAAAVDPTGRYAVAWFDLTRAVQDAGGIGNVGEIGSFQDVTVISLRRGEERAADLSIGFRPREVEFDAAGERAFVVTDDGLSIIDLAPAAAGEVRVAATIPVMADPFASPDMLEVEVTSDGAWAIAREWGRPELRVVDLATGATHVLPLPAAPTDVDLSPDGTRAYAVLRDASALAIVDVPADAIDPAGLELLDLTGQTVGLCVLDPDGRRAILFTNASNVERVVLVDLETPGYPAVVRPLEKGVRALAFAPDGATALVLHSKRPGDPSSATSVEEYVDRSYGYSLLDVASGFAKLAITPVDPGAFAFSHDGRRAYVALDGGDAEGAVARVQVVDLATFVAKDVVLGSPPEAVGVLPAAGVAYVSQRHPLGRVTFLDLETAAARTVTGFELNSHIVD